jgi:hypothetical protein
MDAGELERLEAEAKFASDRLRLYRAKAYALRPVSQERMRELEREADRTAERLDAARRTAGSET